MWHDLITKKREKLRYLIGNDMDEIIKMIELLIVIVLLVIAYTIAASLGKKRQIGFGWSFFFSVFLTPVFGFIITMLSRKYYNSNPKPSLFKKVSGWILTIFFSISSINTVIYFANGGLEHALNIGGFGYLYGRLFSFGPLGLGIYLIQLGRGKNFNETSLIKTDE